MQQPAYFTSYIKRQQPALGLNRGET